jgi:hypothetical protein
VWLALDPVQAHDRALRQFLHEELPLDAQFTASDLTAALQLAIEFDTQIWPHRVPERFELVQAEAAGTLEQTIIELNNEFARNVS